MFLLNQKRGDPLRIAARSLLAKDADY